ncbi:PRC-barrel domain-containing protein [Thalassobaculum litoreum]|uniref:PRC-barrel domain-containing protein n=1 Tax=Thalassobaculum litoreum DSM 18839 TaxID=1123362 RepID=A0A8G2EVW9_9PROT|nr:PRC-barrel domain-containing protein [Thalassobaculum litoreum]SDG03363.1 PRC-barrel domain-containing protein [Thalassobaculum litoreum DSM 18839]
MKRNALTLSLIAGASMLALAGNPAIAGSTSAETNANGTVKTDHIKADGQTGTEIKKDMDKAGEVAKETANTVGAAAATAATATETKIRELLSGDQITEIEGTAVRDANGDSIGEIDEVVRGKSDNVLYFVTDVGGFLGLGEREVVIPASEFTRADDHFILNSATKAELETREQFSEDRYVEVEVNADGTIVAD